MAQSNLKKIAEELEQSLASAKPSPAKPATPKAEQKVETGKSADLNPIVRAVVEYALSRAGEDRTPAQIGEAIGYGIKAAAKELDLAEETLYEAYEAYLGDLLIALPRVQSDGK